MKNNGPICVVLADPPNYVHDPNAGNYPNLGLLYLASFLRSSIPNISLHYIGAAYSPSAHVDRVIAISPDIYGISLCSPFSKIGFNVIGKIKERLPGLPIVCGGPHATANPYEVLRDSKTDICCIGEGEQTFLELVRALGETSSMQKIRGTAFRDPSGNIIISPNRPLIQNLDDIPVPAWDLIRFGDYTGCRKAKAQPSTALVASRGCPFNCTFCSNPVWRLENPRYRVRSPGNIALEVKFLYNSGIREIYLRSDEMNPNIDWAIAVFDALAGLGLADLHFQCNLRANPLSKELAATMQRAGCWLCHIGVESGSQRVLYGINKDITIADIDAAARILKKRHIKVYAFVMLFQVWEHNSELRSESVKEVLSTLRFVLSMRLKGLIDFMSCSLATAYPGSALYDIVLRHNLLRPIRKPKQVITPLDISLRIPRVSLFTIALLRGLGLLVQGVLFFLAPESYRPLTIRQNIRHAVFKVCYLFGLKYR